MIARKKKVVTVLCLAGVILAWRGYVLVAKYLPASANAGASAVGVVPVVDPAVPSGADEIRRLADAQKTVAALDWAERSPFEDVPWVRAVVKPADVPTDTATSEPLPPPNIKLTGVSNSGDQWLAAVQDRIVRVGDLIEENYKVSKIDGHSITLTSRGWAFRYAVGSAEAQIRRLSEEP